MGFSWRTHPLYRSSSKSRRAIAILIPLRRIQKQPVRARPSLIDQPLPRNSEKRETTRPTPSWANNHPSEHPDMEPRHSGLPDRCAPKPPFSRSLKVSRRCHPIGPPPPTARRRADWTSEYLGTPRDKTHRRPFPRLEKPPRPLRSCTNFHGSKRYLSGFPV